jgi:flagellar assembly protein FliH
MSTLAKVFRQEAATAFAAFRPNELGSGISAAGAGAQAFSFPAFEAMPVQTFAPAFDLHPTVQEHHFIDVDVEPVLAGDAFTEHDRVTLEQSVREQAMIEAHATVAATVAAKVSAETDAMRQTLAESLAQVSNLSEEITARMESDVVELALMIAKKVITREVTIDQEIVLNVTKASLAKLHARSIAAVHLNPDDLAYVQEHRDKLNFHGSLELVEDRAITSGGCMVRTDNGDIDGRLESQFDEISYALTGALSGGNSN